MLAYIADVGYIHLKTRRQTLHQRKLSKSPRTKAKMQMCMQETATQKQARHTKAQ